MKQNIVLFGSPVKENSKSLTRAKPSIKNMNPNVQAIIKNAANTNQLIFHMNQMYDS